MQVPAGQKKRKRKRKQTPTVVSATEEQSRGADVSGLPTSASSPARRHLGKVVTSSPVGRRASYPQHPPEVNRDISNSGALNEKAERKVTPQQCSQPC